MGMPTVTNAEQLSIASAGMKQNAIQVEQQLKQVIARSYQNLWRNPNAVLTPDAQVAQLGTSAGVMFTMFAALATFIATVDPTFIVPVPPRTFTINPDGTVTLH